MSVLRQIITVPILLALCAPLAVALATLFRIDHRWADILVQFTAPVLILTVVLAIGLAVVRLNVAAAAAAGVSLLLFLAVWPQWVPTKGRPKPDAPVVTLYSANVLRTNTDVAAMRASIEDADADIVILIELDGPAAQQADTLLAGYPHRTGLSGSRAAGYELTMIASRYPLTQVPTPIDDDLHDVMARVDTPFGPLNVVGVHLTRPWPYQFQWSQITQTMVLDKLVGGLTGPVVVAGDFNSVSNGRIGRMMKTDTGLIPATGFPGTWPSFVPAAFGMTIDQVWRSPDLAIVGRRIGKRTGSDHRPVITRLTPAQPAV